jgi:hypothetical protein
VAPDEGTASGGDDDGGVVDSGPDATPGTPAADENAKVADEERTGDELKQEAAKKADDLDSVDKATGTSSEGLDPLDGLSASEQKAVRSLQARLDEHQAKLDDYIADPDAYDNLGILQGKTPEVRQRIIDGRVRHLQTEINTFQSNINKILGGGS